MLKEVETACAIGAGQRRGSNAGRAVGPRERASATEWSKISTGIFRSFEGIRLAVIAAWKRKSNADHDADRSSSLALRARSLSLNDLILPSTKKRAAYIYYRHRSKSPTQQRTASEHTRDAL